MPQNIQILFGLGAIIFILIALVGGNFKIFGAQIPRVASRAIRIVSLFLGILFLFLTLYPTAQIPPLGLTPTPSATRAATATIRPTPSATPISDILYQANWTAGLAGWTGDASWSATGGTLVNNGGVGPVAGVFVAAPYHPPTPDYAVEADIQFTGSGGYVGVFARCTTSCGSDAATTAYFGIVSASTQKARIVVDVNGTAKFYDTPYSPDTQRHVYRLECKGNHLTFLVDGHEEVPENAAFQTDNTIPMGGEVGLAANAANVTVYRFTVYSL